ncbi:hypothetical protein L9F63_017939, partial [Diploptera punctata]
SPYRKALDSALLQLKESGKLLALKVRWWHRSCQKNNNKRQAASFQFENLAVIFLLLGIMCAVAIIFAVFEQKYKKTVKGNAPEIYITQPSPEIISLRDRH